MYDSIDLFAGAGGWSVASRNLGLTDLGLEVWGPAIATRDAAGLHSVQSDIRLLNPLDDAFLTAQGLIASPPCQSFSAAGKGEGRELLAAICERIEHLEWQPPFHWPEGAQLIFEPLRWVMHRAAVERPYRWIAMEQVPTCLPVWEAYAVALRKLGYSVAVGNLQAEQYGTPQTRKRAIIVAHLERDVALPAPTHSRYYARDKGRLDAGVLPWVSMADALGWSEGFEVVSNYGTGGDSANRGRRTGEQPSATVTEKAGRNKVVLRSNYSAGSPTTGTTAERGRQQRDLDQPAFTVGGRGGDQWMFAGAGQTAVDTAGQVRGAPDQPAHTITGKGTAVWVAERPVPAGYDADRPEWPFNRPATTVVGNFSPQTIAAPGYRTYGGPSRQNAKDSVRVTVAEAGLLQGFPADYPWQGTKTRQYLQVGNAIPVQLAEAVLRAVAL